MKELRKNTTVELVDIHEENSLADLKKFEYLLAERYQKYYQLDMILHVQPIGRGAMGSTWYFSLIDLYTKKVKEVSIEVEVERWVSFREVCRKILVSQDLNRVLRAKKKALGQ